MTSSLGSDSMVPIDVCVDDTMIRVRFRGGLETASPLADFPRLQNASSEDRVRWQLNGKGYGIHWPDVDEDISVRGLVAASRPPASSAIEQVPALVGELLRTTRKLNLLFKDRPFTPDGHLVGSIGEVVAEYIYGITLAPPSTPHVDGYTADGLSVQVKLTGERGMSFGVRWSKSIEVSPVDVLLCLKLTTNGFVEIYNGAFPLDMLAGRNDSSNGQLGLGIARLQDRNPSLLPEKNSFTSLNRWFTPELADVA